LPESWKAGKLESWKSGCVKTTLDLPEDLVREMKLRAVHEGRKLRDVATEIFRRGLAQPSLQTEVATQPGVIQNRVKLPLIQGPPGTPKFNLTPEDIDRILLEQEMKRFNEACGH
jgi:plasmid stability protein